MSTMLYLQDCLIMTGKVQVCHSLCFLGPLAFLCILVAGCHAFSGQPQPTPRDIDAQYFNNCISLPEQLAIGPEMCQDAWGNFSAAFAGKAPSSVESRWVWTLVLMHQPTHQWLLSLLNAKQTVTTSHCMRLSLLSQRRTSHCFGQELLTWSWWWAWWARLQWSSPHIISRFRPSSMNWGIFVGVVTLQVRIRHKCGQEF